MILETVSTYNLGNSLSDTQRAIRKRLHIDIPEGTIRSWIRAHKPLTTYARLRVPGRRFLDPEATIRSLTFRHKQVSMRSVKISLTTYFSPRFEPDSRN